jgi:hypothetical protein
MSKLLRRLKRHRRAAERYAAWTRVSLGAIPA